MPITDRVATDLPVTIKTANYTLLSDDFGREIQFESVSAVTANLPTVTDAENGYNTIIRNIGTGSLAIEPAGLDQIDGASSAILNTGSWRWIRSDGTEWKSVARSGDGAGSVTNVDTAGGLTGGPITTTGTISIADGGVTEQKLATGAVTTVKIADDAVTLNNMPSGTAGNLITYDALGDPAAVSTGTAGDILTSNGVGAAPTFQAISAGGGLQSMQVFTANGTWTKPAGVTKVKVTIIGGGGGGGGTQTLNVCGAGGYGGSAGGYGGSAAIKFIDVSAISSETVTVGTAGTGGAAGTNNGSNGGTSSFGSHCSAPGGPGGPYPASSAVVPPAITTATGGDINLSSQSGDGPRVTGAVGTYFGGWGGSSILGSGATYQGYVTADHPRTPAGGYGGGQGGGNGSAADEGGDGTAGIVIVEEYA